MARWSALHSGAVLAGAVATLVANCLPALTGALGHQLALPAGVLGAFASADIGGLALGGLLAIPLMRASSPRLAAWVGLAWLAIADVASAISPDATVLVLLRGAGGLGGGIALGGAYYVFGLADRERNFAAYSIAMMALGFLAMSVIPVLVRIFDWRAGFLALGVAVVPALFLARHLPRVAVRAARAHGREAVIHGSSRLLLLGTGSMAAFFLGQGGLWAYLEPIGSAGGIAERELALALSVCGAAGLVSSVAVLACGARITRRGVLLLAVAANTAAALSVHTSSAWRYTAAISVYYASLPLIGTIQFGAVTRLPDPGRAAVLASVAQMAGLALGPLAGGQIAAYFGYGAVPWLDVVFVSLAGVLLLPVLRIQARDATGVTRAGTRVPSRARPIGSRAPDADSPRRPHPAGDPGAAPRPCAIHRSER